MEAKRIRETRSVVMRCRQILWTSCVSLKVPSIFRSGTRLLEISTNPSELFRQVCSATNTFSGLSQSFSRPREKTIDTRNGFGNGQDSASEFRLRVMSSSDFIYLSKKEEITYVAAVEPGGKTKLIASYRFWVKQFVDALAATDDDAAPRRDGSRSLDLQNKIGEKH